MVAGQADVPEQAAQCLNSRETRSEAGDDSAWWIGWSIVAAALLIGLALGWWLRGRWDRRSTRSVITQSQSSYLWKLATPRFQCLPERDQGCEAFYNG